MKLKYINIKKFHVHSPLSVNVDALCPWPCLVLSTLGVSPCRRRPEAKHTYRPGYVYTRPDWRSPPSPGLR